MPSNGKLSNYTVEYRMSNSSTVSKNTIATIENEIEIKDLKPFTAYEIRVNSLYFILFVIGFFLWFFGL